MTQNAGGHSAVEIQARHRAWLDAQPTITRCICGWQVEGSAEYGREAAKVHRALEHPELKKKKRRPTREQTAMTLQRFSAQKDLVARDEALRRAGRAA